MVATTVESRYYTVKEAADLLRVDQSTVRRWLIAGKLRSVKVEGRQLIPVSALEEKLRGK